MFLDPVQVCLSKGGVATLAELLERGVRMPDLTAALASGRLVRVRRGVIASAGFPPAVLHALRHSGRLTCHSVLAAKKVWLLDDDERLHLHLGGGGHLIGPDGCLPVVHRSETRAGGGPAAVAVLPALAELGRCLGEEHLVVALDSARHLGLVSTEDLSALRLALPRRLRRIADQSTDLCESGLESLVRSRLRRLGIVAVPQFLMGDGGHRDLVVGDRLLIETDGGSHDDRRQRLKDLERDAYAAAAGFITLRFGYAQIVHRWAEVEAAILTVVRQGRHLRDR